MSQPSDTVHQSGNPLFRLAEIALRRAAEKAQRQIRQAGFEPVNRLPDPPASPAKPETERQE
ncbi:MAG: hypothetical protein HQM03_10390 [Magnetococcales bacterium]|nr:hypothetical protein [Magnetococcales bacterium]